MKTAIALCVLLAGVGCKNPLPLTKTKHGWSNARVIATRYKNPYMGFNIGFETPQNCETNDREEVVKVFEHNGGHIFEMGGYPCAPIYAVFEGVRDRESADKKLQEFIPQLTKVLEELQ